MTVTIRPVAPGDVDTILTLEAELFGSDAWSPEVVAAELGHPASHYVVLADGEQIVGYGGLRSPGPGLPGDIQTLAIHPDYRGVGWGRKMLVHLLDIAAARQVPEVFLEVRADNEAARHLYERCGFREIDRRPGYYQPDGVDAIVMCRTEAVNGEGAER